MRRAASRAAWTAGSNSEIKMPMIVMTTSNSTNVNPPLLTRRIISSPNVKEIHRSGRKERRDDSIAEATAP